MIKEKIKLVTFIDLLFLLLLLISGAFPGPVGSLLYYAAFLVPIGLGLYFVLKERKTQHGAAPTLEISIKKEELFLSLPLFVPVLALIMLISFGTSALMNSIGVQSSVSYGDEPFLLALVIHALVPALAEELLFRYIPTELLKGAKSGTVILITSLTFSFAHANLFSIPYAFIAGFAFAAINLATGSILPSLILHFLNNALSLSLIYASNSLRIAILICLAVLLAASVTAAFIMRRRYAERAASVLSFDKSELIPHPLLFVFASLFIAITNIIFS